MRKNRDKIRYYFDCFLAKSAFTLVLALLILIVIIVLILGLIIFLAEPNSQLATLLWDVFNQTLDAGNLADRTGSILYLVLMTLATLVGIFISSLFISIILDGFQRRLESLRRGRSKVIESNHTLILGYNDSIFVIVKELIEANRSVRKPVIVILSEIDSVEMNQKLKDNIVHFSNTKIICRTGLIYKKQDLSMCSIENAKSVIILENDFNTIKSLLVVTDTEFFTNKTGHVTVLMRNKDNIDVARNIGKDKIEIVYLSSAITRIIAQTCLQTGLSQVYNDLFDYEGDEIYFYQHQDLVGHSFKEIVQMFDTSIVIGVFSNGKTMVKPNFDYVIKSEDQIILIDADDNTIEITGLKKSPYLEQIVNKKHKANRRVEEIAMVGFNENALEVAKEFDNYLAPGSRIDFLVNSSLHKSEIMLLQEKLKNISISVVENETYQRKNLEAFITPTCSRVIIFANQGLTNGEKDSQTLLSLLHLRTIEEARGISLDVISEIADVKNADIIDLAKVDDFIISDLIANRMVAQISENRYLAKVFEDLLDSDGSEVYLKPAEEYVKLGEEVDFYIVSDSALNRNEIAIGYQVSKKVHQTFLKINPDKKQTLTFKKGDMIIVIAED